MGLAFARTMNGSQGRTLDRVGVYLREPVFGHGQLYVVISKVRQFADVKIKLIDGPYQTKLNLPTICQIIHAKCCSERSAAEFKLLQSLF